MNSSALAWRSCGRFDMARASTRSRLVGTSMRPVGASFAFSIRDISVTVALSPPGTSNGLRPAIREYTVAPSDQTSLATVPDTSSWSTSGADHGIDSPTASLVSASPSVAAMPKSESTGCPYAVVRMFDGLMSRCSTPCRCAVSTALAMRTPMESTSASGSCTAR